MTSDSPTNARGQEYLRTIFDTIPLPAFIVDAELRILDFNHASARLLGPNPTLALRQRTGDAFHCIHAEVSGCGNGLPCQDCVIRNSVRQAIAGGKTHRRAQKAELRTSGKTVCVDLLISATPLTGSNPPQVLLLLEDITELLSLRGLIPICAGCKKVRDDQQSWHSIDSYLHTHMHATLTHGLCPSCLNEQMIDMEPKKAQTATKRKVRATAPVR